MIILPPASSLFTNVVLWFFFLEWSVPIQEYDHTPEEERVRPSQITDIYAVTMTVPKHSYENENYKAND